MTVEDIVRDYLKQHGFDGLIGDECGCDLEDLAWCGEMRTDCEPGMKVACPPECSEAHAYHIEPRKVATEPAPIGDEGLAEDTEDGVAGVTEGRDGG